MAVLSKMFSLAIRWGMRTDNPAKGIERNPEDPRQRYLSGDELRRLTAALATHPSGQAADAIRLMLLTGARSRSEVLRATWDQFDDVDPGYWRKPSSHTKQKRQHHVPLSAPARQLLAEMRTRQKREAGTLSPYLFPGRFGDGPMVDVDSSWKSICRAADLRGLRLHDLRQLRLDPGVGRPVIAGDRRPARP